MSSLQEQVSVTMLRMVLKRDEPYTGNRLLDVILQVVRGLGSSAEWDHPNK